MKRDRHVNLTHAKRSPSVELLAIAAPTIITMMSYPLKQFVDAWMVGKLGPDALAAQGNGAIATYLPISFIFGLFAVVNTWVAQHNGAGHPERGAAYAWNSLWISFFGWIGLLIFAIAVGPLFGLADHSPSIHRMETAYARIMLGSALFALAARGMSQFFYGVHRPFTVMIATIVGNLVNLGLDYVLIFGKFGAPALGVHGAGYATVIGSAVEFAIPMAVFLSPAFHQTYGTRFNKALSRDRIAEIVRVGWPGAVQWVNELASWGIMMTIFIGRFGAEANAAGWVAMRYMQLSFMPAVGMGIAVTAVVGRYVGAGDFAAAEHRTWLATRMAMLYMGAFAVLFVVFREASIRFFTSDEYSPEQAAELLRIGKQVMILAALFQIFDALAIVLMGALRGAGDTVWPGMVSMVQSWVFVVGGGWLAIELAPQLESIGPWIAAAVYIVVCGVTMAWRFRFGPWRQMKLVDNLIKAPPPIVAASG